MKNITISEEAYNEFKAFLEENNISDFNIRINFAGFACSGPIFNISVSEATDDDEIEKINDISFIVEKTLIDQFGGFIILSTEENEGNGLSLKPVITPEGGCGGSCSGCHH
ncbi:HesB-like protein [Clostridium saccharobutylicum]|uniref:HesB-like selenoprotein n=1 Tax=Clostridium saccharobutylicum DSM 13864 TaxID=1345695 RepID=U5MZW6_CLOSA|nr:HesB-like protein [Clostridium saccharobutylicum]AGX45057.1 HesB-like selenoprotein [Clostridium saccharobutylicum DSM 13864]AQR92339.1 iron-sulfur cluster insertion protein ErpA [Clostridium saccharobutylicum]AQS02242.1 iron-sulfur cluster insertion protein ErpA [Clostridium saccharobutylicum]AQS11845.1 iron-sulfur cluster insertion protein ErpA [Clostridium saccharobutylicum]AQS16225.1 iron-sulfur cluster insertion protein ErpA [Clostridium saccharobutylicum]